MEERTKTLIHGLSAAEFAAVFEGLGERAFRTKQVWKWLYVQRVAEWGAMSNVPAALRETLAATYSLEPVQHLGMDGEPSGTRKILVGLRDGQCVEEVLIPARDRLTLCVSSQVGCRFGCTFCASGQGGFVRNLEAGEMVGQVLLACREHGDRPTNLVFMGMGEPFDNYEPVLKAIRILNNPDGMMIGARHITISTSGVIPGIDRLATEGIQVELSVSLHAPDNDLRDQLMPVNRRYPLKDLLAACERYADGTRRLVTFEYTLIAGVNDSRRQADMLVRLLKPLPARVNVIPLSPVEGFRGEPPAPEAVDLFMKVLSQAGVNVTLRASKGGRIEAACGQLRRRSPKRVGGLGQESL